jgi:flavin reductase (DIM6/NTAB) family NADH-FMN oxidoreductase RutF
MEINKFEFSGKVMEQLSQGGAFLTVKGDKRINTMTIGWGFIGYMWGKPVFIVAVRYSRFTYELMREANEFSVSIPFDGNLKKELTFCGSKSGRNYDKFKECGLTLQQGEKIQTPYIKECNIHFECKTIYRQTLEAELISHPDIAAKYKDHDYHAMYYGELISCHN